MRIIQLDFATKNDSTAIEHALHKAVFQRDPWSAIPDDPKLEVESEDDAENSEERQRQLA